MKIDITTTTVFALFYAIMFGGMLNRLSDWSAFAREDDKEEARTVYRCVLLSYVLLHVLPPIYFAVAVALLSCKPAPTGVFTLSLWSIALFLLRTVRPHLLPRLVWHHRSVQVAPVRARGG
jgi:hypothetical protein